MSRKSKGINAERDLIHKFWGNNWAAIRVAGSGSSSFPSPDLLAGNRIRKMAIECKVTKEDKKYFSMEDIEQLKTFSDLFGAEPWIAVKFGKESWFFINLEDLEKTPQGFMISVAIARNKGLLFEEIVK
jgi:holliday junction resolvase Hjr